MFFKYMTSTPEAGLRLTEITDILRLLIRGKAADTALTPHHFESFLLHFRISGWLSTPVVSTSWARNSS